MALFLTRLAGLVGIDDGSDDPDDPEFTDTGDLSDRVAGWLSGSWLIWGSPRALRTPRIRLRDDVTRGQMALFIARTDESLMVPMADGAIGLSTTTQYGYTPSDVVDNDKDVDVIGSSFTRSGYVPPRTSTTRSPSLYELGVAAGISDYVVTGPGADITRASMAGFMAAVLDHSNARPAGLSIQATPS